MSSQSRPSHQAKIYWNSTHVLTLTPLGPHDSAHHGTIDWNLTTAEIWDYLLGQTEPRQGPKRDDYPEKYEFGWTLRSKGKQPVEIDFPGIDLETNTVAWRELE